MLTPLALAAQAFWNVALRPPMGWNSWDCFATTVTEAQTKAQADVMAEKLKSFGWEYVVVDIQWYEPDAKSFEYRQGAKLTLDGHGRLQPAPNRFPSAANGKGFKALADYVHGKGLKFGLHLMRGIPREAVQKKLPVLDSLWTADQIADTTSTCPWNPDMYGLDMTKPGAQAYLNSVFRQYAEWGVDYVKVDDIARPYHQSEVEGVREAIDASGRRMVLSLSPGETRLDAAAHVKDHANLWRISDDFWDDWKLLYDQFDRCRIWAPVSGPGHWPDADMLPLGKLRFGEPTKFTRDEQVTMMTLWAVFRSPLMLGCDLTELDEWTLHLITNSEVLAVNQQSFGGMELRRDATTRVWTTHLESSPDTVLALFNVTDRPQTIEVGLQEAKVIASPHEQSERGVQARAKVRDLWSQHELPSVTDKVSAEVPAHGARLFRLRPDY